MISKLSYRVKIGFGIGDLGGNLFFTIMGFYLLFFLTDQVGLPPALAGLAIGIGKIWDAVTDPLVGYLSDRSLTRFGRRRPFMFIGAILLFGGMIALFSPYEFPSVGVAFGIITGIYCFLNLAFTLVNIPYAALLPELTPDFDQRTVLTGFRMSFAVVGTFIGAGLVLPLRNVIPGSPWGWTFMGLVMGTIILLSTMATIVMIREPKRESREKTEGFIKTYVQTLSLKPFLLSVFPWMLHNIGVAIVQGTLVYYYKYIYGDEGLFQFALLSLLAVSLAFIPIWVSISKRIGKRLAYNLGMTIVILGILTFFMFAHRIPAMYSLIIMLFSGIGLSTHYVMPHSIVPDVVEYDAVRHGIRREGAFSSMWTFSSKIGQALGLALLGWLLGAFGFVSGTDPGSTTLLGIRLLCGPVPAVFIFLGIMVLRHYPITRDGYKEMMETGKIPESFT